MQRFSTWKFQVLQTYCYFSACLDFDSLSNMKVVSTIKQCQIQQNGSLRWAGLNQYANVSPIPATI